MTRNPDPPLVTFAVITYNQEGFVRQAVESAFSQTSNSMEIILSDDFSNDQTFEILKEMTESYKGPFEIKLRQNLNNMGVSQHVNELLKECRTDIVVLAAGDDISSPDRVEKLVRCFEERSPSLIHSDVEYIDADGTTLQDRIHNVLFLQEYSIREASNSMALYIGATGAFKRSLYTKYGNIQYVNAYEDLVYGYRAALENSVAYVDEKLVKYRIGVGMTSQKKIISVKQRRKEIKTINRIKRDVLWQRYRDIKYSSRKDKLLLHIFILWYLLILKNRYLFSKIITETIFRIRIGWPR